MRSAVTQMKSSDDRPLTRAQRRPRSWTLQKDQIHYATAQFIFLEQSCPGVAPTALRQSLIARALN
jgi:hypothetical protein